MKTSLIIILLLLAGCSLVPGLHTRPPAATITLPSGAQLGQSGDAQKPASVATAATVTTIPLPSSSLVILDEKKPGIVTLQLAAQSELKTETRSEKAEAPQAFTPPAPPTPVEISAGRVSVWFWCGIVAGVAAALFGLVRGWDMVMYGGGAVAAACGFALFVQAHPALIGIIGAGAALAVAGPYFWHTTHKDNPSINPPKTP